VHAILATRHDVRLGLHQLRLAGELAEIRGADLRFSGRETRELLDASGIALSEAGAALLYRRTEGWAAGLRLAALSLQGEDDPETFLAEFTGNDHAVAFAGSQGSFQLNTYKPVILHNVLSSVELLAAASSSFEERCVRGLRPNREVIQQHVGDSLMLVTALSPHIGYEKAARIAQTAHREGSTLRDAALKLGYVTAEQFDQWVNPESMTGPTG